MSKTITRFCDDCGEKITGNCMVDGAFKPMPDSVHYHHALMIVSGNGVKPDLCKECLIKSVKYFLDRWLS